MVGATCIRAFDWRIYICCSEGIGATNTTATTAITATTATLEKGQAEYYSGRR
jgi:hypothetical protein